MASDNKEIGVYVVGVKGNMGFAFSTSIPGVPSLNRQQVGGSCYPDWLPDVDHVTKQSSFLMKLAREGNLVYAMILLTMKHTFFCLQVPPT